MKNTIKATYAPTEHNSGVNDCYISAAATAMNIPYDESLIWCLKAGWDDGMYLDKAVEMAQEQGWEIVGCKWNDWQLLVKMPDDTIVLPQCSISRLVNILKNMKDKTFIVFTNDHAFCVKNGNVYDHGQTAANKRAVMFFVVNDAQGVDTECLEDYHDSDDYTYGN